MDNISWGCNHGRRVVGRCDVPALAASDEAGSQLVEHGCPWLDWALFRDRYIALDLLVDHHRRRAARDLDIPPTVC